VAAPATAHPSSGGAPAALYRLLTAALSPAAPLLLRLRAAREKEDPARLSERTGYASLPRPAGTLIWIHGASVGESLATLPLVSALLEKPERHVLVTTGTVTSARLMAERLPGRALHQYVPIDSPGAVRRFLDHWRPDLALFVESEFWPNLVLETHSHGVPMALVNARLSEASFKGWRRARGLAAGLLGAFDECLAQDAVVASRLTALGARSVSISGSLKADAPPLPVDEDALAAFNGAVNGRPLFVAASTHPGEDAPLLDVADSMGRARLDAVTVIVPRHPARGAEIEGLAAARGFSVSRRSAGTLPSSDTAIYVADTMGELGLFYRATKFAFLGGSLVKHGGQNPLEAAQLNTAVITGPYTENFEETFRVLLAAQGEGRVRSVEELTALVLNLAANPVAAARLGRIAKAAAETLGGALARTVDAAEKLLAHARA
jgi:3-deoxy-D-manno-octulosonic-acid transferase